MRDAEKARRLRAKWHAATAANGGVAPVEKHNVNTYRQHGCRCDACRADATSYALATRRRARERTLTGNGPDIVHGAAGYQYHRCRCEECIVAHEEQVERGRLARIGKEPPNHGASGYTNYGCRCEVCKDGDRVARRRRAGKEPR